MDLLKFCTRLDNLFTRLDRLVDMHEDNQQADKGCFAEAIERLERRRETLQEVLDKWEEQGCPLKFTRPGEGSADVHLRLTQKVAFLHATIEGLKAYMAGQL